MKVLLVVPWEDRGGVVTVAWNLARYFRDRGHRVMFFHPGSTVVLKTRRLEEGFEGAQLRLSFPFAEPRPIVSALAFPFLFPIVLLQLIWFVRKHRIDVVNLHYPIDNFFYFALCKSLLRFRLVTSVHGSDAFVNGRPKERYSRAFRWLLHASDLVILPSDDYRKKLVQLFAGIGRTTTYIHNGTDPLPFAGSGHAVDETIARPYILCIAHLRELKGIDVLLRAAAPLLRTDPALSVVLAGDGPLRGELQGLAASLGIGDRTRFLGTKGALEIAGLLHRCEVLVLPSRAESFGIVLLEAMASRKPVIATSVGGIPEIVEHAKSGLLVEPDDPASLTEALRAVLTNGELKKMLAENGRARMMERFTLQRHGEAYEKALSEILAA